MEYRKLPKGTEEISVIGFGFIHCIDHPADLERYIDSGALEHIQTLKKQGIVRHIGLSSHTPEIVNRVLDLGILDVVMFSINPAYDYRHGDYAYGGVDERETLYRRFQAEQVGITVMKPFGGEQLLDGALINQYYDLAKIGDTLAADHYRKLEAHAGDCVQCGHCDRRRPFHVAQSDRMKEIAAYFGA